MLSVGLVVDDAIVVVENVERHMREGMSRMNAALVGARELIGPIIAMTITLAAVYTPIALQGGLTGALFREFALTLAGAVFISGIVALVLSPMMSAHLLRADHVDHGFSGWVNRTFDRFRDWYGRSSRSHARRAAGGLHRLDRPLASRRALLVHVAARRLAPKEDQGVIFGIMTAPANATIDDTIRYADAAGKIFAGYSGHAFHFPDHISRQRFRRNGFETVGQAQDADERLSAGRCSKNSQRFPEFKCSRSCRQRFPARIISRSVSSSLRRPSHERILEFAQGSPGKAMQAHMFQFSDIDTKIDQPQAQIVFDHDKVASMGLDMQKVGATCPPAIGGNYVNWFNIAGRSYKVIPQIKRVDRLNPEQLKDIYVTGPNNQLIPLSTVATIKHKTVARSLNRMQQLNAVTISGVPTRSLDATLKFLEDEAAQNSAERLRRRLHRRIASAAH